MSSAVCCCSLAGTVACQTCSQNPFAVMSKLMTPKPTALRDIMVNPKPQTNYDRIRAMNCEKLANQLVSEQYVAMKMVLTLLCQKLKDEEILDEKDAKEGFCDFENEVKKRWGEMVKEKLEWLKAPADKEDE